jgi:ferredoxin
MKATVDKDLCIGCGVCVEVCPEVFEISGDTAQAKVNPVPPGAEGGCRDAADQCPVEAIKIEDAGP